MLEYCTGLTLFESLVCTFFERTVLTSLVKKVMRASSLTKIDGKMIQRVCLVLGFVPFESEAINSERQSACSHWLRLAERRALNVS